VKQWIIMTVLGFLSGAIMYSYIIPKVFFKDGNPGSSNVIRAVGVQTGVLCMAMDVAKAFVPVFISVNILGIRGYYLIPITLAPILGHAFSPFLGFHGGKAVSTTYGSMVGLVAISRFVLVLAILMFFFRFVIVLRPDSTGVIVSLAAAAAVAFFLEPAAIKIIVAAIAAVICIKQFLHPDKGPRSVSFWHYSVKVEDRRLVFSRI
jgi:glycerol-3-phosphate acyltransferase PlsY